MRSFPAQDETARSCVASLPQSACYHQPPLALPQALPASARLWFSDLRDRATVAAVERYSAAAVSTALLAGEFAAVADVSSACFAHWARIAWS